MQADQKTFRLKARGDFGSGRTELLIAFKAYLETLGMTAVMAEKDHHLIVTTTKAQRVALYEANRARGGADK